MHKMVGAEWTLSPQKRGLDIALATLLLPEVLPAVVLTAAAIKGIDGMSPYFWQMRYTRDFKPFWMLKMRTMPENTPETPSANGGGDERATPLGKKLRATHLDELPQIYNILRGEMSWTGFRPLIQQETEDTFDVLGPREQREYKAATAVVKGGLFCRYMIDLDRRNYTDNDLRGRALGTVEYANTITPWEDIKLHQEGLGLGITGLAHFVKKNYGLEAA